MKGIFLRIFAILFLGMFAWMFVINCIIMALVCPFILIAKILYFILTGKHFSITKVCTIAFRWQLNWAENSLFSKKMQKILWPDE